MHKLGIRLGQRCLKIVNCNKLTDECLTNRIYKIKTLHKIKIQSCENITQELVLPEGGEGPVWFW